VEKKDKGHSLKPEKRRLCESWPEERTRERTLPRVRNSKKIKKKKKNAKLWRPGGTREGENEKKGR